MVTVIISSCIQPCETVRYTRLKSPRLRLKQYRNCLNKVIEVAYLSEKVQRIIYIDNSCYDLSHEFCNEQLDAHSKGVNLDIIQLPALEYINKGVGENQIMKHVTTLVHDNEFVLKLTGRLEYPDLWECIYQLSKTGFDKNYFIYDQSHKTVKLKTYVFGMIGKDFKTVFNDLEIRDKVSLSEEMNFEYQVETKMKQNNISYLPFPNIKIIGNYASTGKPYQE